MRYFTYYDYGIGITVVSENDIINSYYPLWYEKMCQKYGKKIVDRNYSEKDCINDWVVNNRAWENV